MTKDNTKNLPQSDYPNVARYIEIHALMTELGKERDAIAKDIKSRIKSLPGYDVLSVYRINGSLEVSTNAQNAIDQEAVLGLLARPHAEWLHWLPRAVKFAPLDKDLADAKGILVVTSSEPVLRVVKKGK